MAIMQNLKISQDSNVQVQSLIVTTNNGTDFARVELYYPDMPVIKVFLRGPQGFLQRQDRSLRALFLATGFFNGADSTLLLGTVADTVFVGFDYPYQINDIKRDPAKLLQTFRVTPGQIALSLKWISQQARLAPERLDAMAVSLRGLFLPAALHLAQEMNVNINQTVFAYTGADVKTILANNLRGQMPDFMAQILLATVPTINILNDPKLHLPYLNGSFLVVYSQDDQVIPQEASEQTFALLPNPKQQVILQGPHIDVGQAALIQQTKTAVMQWLR
jgi:pimeloyl-ACP methyl ester carboxylesterase